VSGGGLQGRRVLVTRRLEQATSLVQGLEALGAVVRTVPTLEVVAAHDPGPFDNALRDLASYDGLLLTSANSVSELAARLEALGVAAEALGAVEGADVGSATATAFAERFPALPAPLSPADDYRAESLLREMKVRGVRGRRYLLPASELARETLRAGLEAEGALVDQVVAYRTVTPRGLAVALAEALEQGVDLAIFASPSAVEGFVAAAGLAACGRLPVAVIGPVTEAAARAVGFEVVAVASPSTSDGLLRSLLARFG
jgi:uroporphyrinogen-III synthase